MPLGFEHPRWLAGLPLLALLLWWLRAGARLPQRVTGTSAWWGAADAAGEARERPRQRTPAWALAAALALACALLALAGPRARAQPRSWQLWVDLSPSMQLPADGKAGPSRLARALEACAQWMRTRPAGERFEFRAPYRAARTCAAGELPEADWLAAGDWPQPEPDWPALDRAGIAWLLDRAPEPPPRAAGWFASGGGAVAGPLPGAGDFEFDGSAVRASRAPRGPGWVHVEGALPRALAELLADWALARGLASSGAAAGAALCLAAPARAASAAALPVDAPGPAHGEADSDRLARDGWSAAIGALAPLSAARDRPTSVWLSGSSGVERVLVSPGRIELGFGELGPIEGDAAGFAVAWSELFDRCRLPAPGEVALAERAAAGEPSHRAPLEAELADAGWPAKLASALAVLAGALAASAAVLAGRRRRFAGAAN